MTKIFRCKLGKLSENVNSKIPLSLYGQNICTETQKTGRRTDIYCLQVTPCLNRVSCLFVNFLFCMYISIKI